MRTYSLLAPMALGAAAVLLTGCYPYTPPALSPATQPAPGGTTVLRTAAPEQRAPVTILISIDGFRADYLDRGLTPNLSRLAAGGVHAAMRPSFPSKTFPNHWTIVTGDRPDRNGIVANKMEDAARPGEQFKMGVTDPFWWNGAEPIWVTAERAGIRTGTMFWPGSDVAWGGTKDPRWSDDVIGGTRPTDWWPFGQAVSGGQRVDGVLDWLKRPAAVRPSFVTLYFDTVDTAGHRYGPDSPEVNAAVGDIDRVIGRLLTGLAAIGQPANLVIVADHGMAATPASQRILLDEVLGKDAYRAIDTGAFASIVPVAGNERSVAAKLAQRRPGMTCWPKARIPARLHYGSNPRIAPLFCLADVGWTIVRDAQATIDAGNHGFDKDAPEMRALFIASGPAFRAAGRLPDFDNVDVAPLLRDVLGLPAAANIDGDDAPFRGVLKR